MPVRRYAEAPRRKLELRDTKMDYTSKWVRDAVAQGDRLTAEVKERERKRSERRKKTKGEDESDDEATTARLQ